MAQARAEAALAPGHGDVPVGAVLLDPAGRVVAQAHNERELTGDPTAHAEVRAPTPLLRGPAPSARASGSPHRP
ncbi:MAG: nucleoside deaminase, partial [Micropruina sp.]